jgi:DNA-directed RNA polymerase subunit M/transcription elongation factor TFIIS
LQRSAKRIKKHHRKPGIQRKKEDKKMDPNTCENAGVHNTTNSSSEVSGFTVATESGKSLHYSLYRCGKCGYEWAYFYDVNAGRLERISVGEYNRAKLYR